MEPKVYHGEHTGQIAFPLGGMGAGGFCLNGNASLGAFSLFHRPDLWNEPKIYGALSFENGGQRQAVLLEGQVPTWKVFGQQKGGKGVQGKHYGLPRFGENSFSARFPFGTVQLSDAQLPIKAEVTGWSPFSPGDEDSASLPVAALEYTITNTGSTDLETVFSFHCENFLKPRAGAGGACRVENLGQGIALHYLPGAENPNEEGWFAFACGLPDTTVDAAWMRGHPFNHAMVNWRNILAGNTPASPAYPADQAGSPGGSLYAPLHIPAGQSRTVCVRMGWYVPLSTLREDEPELMQADAWKNDTAAPTYEPWYAGRFEDIGGVMVYWQDAYAALRHAADTFAGAFFASTLDADAVDAAAANLSILKSPTVMRQRDGRLWLWEGCDDFEGSCYGSCTHVWNYAQAICHLFPRMERSLRETEFEVAQEADGYQSFRTPLPIRPATRRTHAAADGQLGGIVKVYRDFHICGDKAWLQSLWPQVKQSLEHCIATWDKAENGHLDQPHHTTFDISIWGPDSLTQSMYVAALAAAGRLAQELADAAAAQRYTALYGMAKAYFEDELFNGEYFNQRVMYKELGVDYKAFFNAFIDADHPEIMAMMELEGPPYQYGNGCLSDGTLGHFMAYTAGLGELIDAKLLDAHLDSVVKYNYRENLRHHANPQRGGYAVGNEAGLLTCSWPYGGQPTQPLLYSNEVWTGIEYEVAVQLASRGKTADALRLVRATRARYDGRVRNPFDEYECGHWYGRAMASYGLLQALAGIRYDAVRKTLFIAPWAAGDFTSFISTEAGYGLAGVQKGEPFIQVCHGAIEVGHIEYTPAPAAQ